MNHDVMNQSTHDAIAESAKTVVKSTAVTTGAAAEATAATAMVVANTAKLASTTLEEATPHVAKIATDTSKITSHATGILAAPCATAEFAVKAALHPVNRLLKTFTIAVDRGFDTIDRLIAPNTPAPAFAS